MPIDFAELQRRKRPNSAKRDICLDPGVIDAYNEAVAARAEAARKVSGNDDDEGLAAVAAAEEAVTTAAKALREAIVTFEFRALGADEMEALQDAHPPTREQQAAQRSKGGTINWNVDTYPQALVAACITEPELSEAEVAVLWKSPEWNDSERTELFLAAVEANSSKRIPDLGKGSGPTTA